AIFFIRKGNKGFAVRCLTLAPGWSESPAKSASRTAKSRGRNMRTKRLALLFTGLVALGGPAIAAAPVPQLTGPVAAPDIPGAPTHNYIFFASNHDLAAHGYVEEEYFIRGTATTYKTGGTTAASVQDSDLPYYTRIVVRR